MSRQEADGLLQRVMDGEHSAELRKDIGGKR